MSNLQYFSWCKEALLVYLKKPKEKKVIESLSRCIIPEIIANGYSPEYIFYAIKNSFILGNIDDYTCIDKFFSFFDFKKKEFTVYIAIDRRSAIAIKPLVESRLDTSFNDDGYFNKFYIDNDKTKICFNSIEAYDSNIAMSKAYKSLSLFVDFLTFIRDKKVIHINDTGMVRDLSSNSCYFCPVNKRSYNIHSLDFGDMTEKADYSISRLLFNARREFPKIRKIIELHNTAITINDYRNSFLCFWSILEVLCINDSNKSKIENIIQNAVPVMKKDFFESIFNQLLATTPFCEPELCNYTKRQLPLKN